MEKNSNWRSSFCFFGIRQVVVICSVSPAIERKGNQSLHDKAGVDSELCMVILSHDLRGFPPQSSGFCPRQPYFKQGPVRFLFYELAPQGR